MKLKFQYPEDDLYFKKLIRSEDEDLKKYLSLFDLSSPKTKRFNFNAKRKEILEELIRKYGKICMINYPEICDIKSGFNVDHLIPLSSNKLNEEIRKMKGEKGKKVLTQSFGSNHENNLILACRNCNSHKKHRIEKEIIQKILKSKF